MKVKSDSLWRNCEADKDNVDMAQLSLIDISNFSLFETLTKAPVSLSKVDWVENKITFLYFKGLTNALQENACPSFYIEGAHRHEKNKLMCLSPFTIS